MKRFIKWAVAVGLILALSGSGAYLLFKPRPPVLPANILSQISYAILVPAKASSIQSNSANYNAHTGSLTYTINDAGTTIVMTEQATPTIFSDVPQYYSTLVERLNQYSSLSTVNGTVYLTKPKELNGQQQAVLNNSGTLVFAHPKSNLSNDAWRRFFNNLQTSKPSS